MSIPLLSIGPAPLALEPLVSAVAAESDGRDPSAGSGQHGAIVTFLGLVRNHNQGRRVQYLEYEAYAPLAIRTFERITGEVHSRWAGVRMALHHRIGRLEIGEASVAIVVGSPHRGDAYAACRYVIERVKQIAPIWKREYFDGGDVWIEGATADPEDARAREEAERVACA